MINLKEHEAEFNGKTNIPFEICLLYTSDAADE